MNYTAVVTCDSENRAAFGENNGSHSVKVGRNATQLFWV